MAVWLGIDLGTSSVKTVMMDAGGAVVASASAPLTVSQPRSGWSEQDPADWWTAACATLDRLAAERPAEMATARGIGLSGHMHGATLLGADDAPLRPCILWNDGRAEAQCAALEAAADFRGIAGNRMLAGFTAPKLAWVREHEPQSFERVAKVLLPKDYLRLLLTGEHVSEMSDAAGTGWLDVAARDWSAPLLAATGLTRDQMPALVEGSAPSGRLRAELARRWGMERAPVVAGGGGDNAAAACGVGAVRPGGGFLSIGTSGVLFAVTDGFAPNTAQAVHAFCHALPRTWHQMGVMLSAADSLEWLARVTGRDAADLAASVDPAQAARWPLFLPYLSGERTPHADTGLRGGFVGLARDHDAADLAGSVLTGVACAFADCADALRAAGTRFSDIVAVGGGARSDVWLTLVADLAQIPLARPAGAEAGAALGAARLGFCAAEDADAAAVCPSPAAERTFEPDPARAAQAAETLARWRAAFPAARLGGRA